MCEDELPERLVKSEAVNALAGGEHEIARGAVPGRRSSVTQYQEWERAGSHGVAGSDHVLARTEDVLDPALRTILLITSQNRTQ